MNITEIKNIFANLPPKWKAILCDKYKSDMAKIVHAVDGDVLCPSPGLIFEAFRQCGQDIKIVLVGQDPYAGKAMAMGLSFSVPYGVQIPPSLINIYKCMLKQGLITKMPTHGCLLSWAKQGVLLLNMALTTTQGRPEYHIKLWEPFMKKLLGELAGPDCIFILLGATAQSIEPLLGDSRVLKWGHPSPMNSANRSDGPTNFINCDVFTRANELLGTAAIDWNSVNDDLPNDDLSTARMPMENVVYAFTDGAAVGNGTDSCRASYAYVIKSESQYTENAGLVAKAATNNRGELTAIYEAIKYLIDKKITGRVIIVSDSKYSINCITRWYHVWAEQPSKMEKKKNLDLLKEITEVTKEYTSTGGGSIEYVHVHSHTKEMNNLSSYGEWFMWKGNERADSLCTRLLRPL